MKMKTIIRLLQRLVPAENRGCEPASAELVNSPIPADEQAGSPAPVESPQPVEALVEALEAELAQLERDAFELWLLRELDLWLPLARQIQSVRSRIASERSRASTGGNDEAEPLHTARKPFDREP